MQMPTRVHEPVVCLSPEAGRSNTPGTFGGDLQCFDSLRRVQSGSYLPRLFKALSRYVSRANVDERALRKLLGMDT